MWQNGLVWLANKTIFFDVYKKYQAGWGGGVGGAKTHKILSVTFDIGNSSLCDLTMVKPHKCNCV